MVLINDILSGWAPVTEDPCKQEEADIVPLFFPSGYRSKNRARNLSFPCIIPGSIKYQLGCLEGLKHPVNPTKKRIGLMFYETEVEVLLDLYIFSDGKVVEKYSYFPVGVEMRHIPNYNAAFPESIMVGPSDPGNSRSSGYLTTAVKFLHSSRRIFIPHVSNAFNVSTRTHVVMDKDIHSWEKSQSGGCTVRVIRSTDAGTRMCTGNASTYDVLGGAFNTDMSLSFPKLSHSPIKSDLSRMSIEDLLDYVNKRAHPGFIPVFTAEYLDNPDPHGMFLRLIQDLDIHDLILGNMSEKDPAASQFPEVEEDRRVFNFLDRNNPYVTMWREGLEERMPWIDRVNMLVQAGYTKSDSDIMFDLYNRRLIETTLDIWRK